jgi:hypothetical protein
MQLDVSILTHVTNNSSQQATTFGTDQLRLPNLNLCEKHNKKFRYFRTAFIWLTRIKAYRHLEVKKLTKNCMKIYSISTVIVKAFCTLKSVAVFAEYSTFNVSLLYKKQLRYYISSGDHN